MKYDEQTEEVKALMDRRAQLETKIEVLSQDKEYLEQQIAEAVCPYKVGQRFNAKDGAKIDVKQCQIISIKFDSYYGFKLEVKKVKKNGELFSDKCCFLEFYWDMENPIDPEGER